MKEIDEQIIDELIQKSRTDTSVYIYAITESDYGCEEFTEEQGIMSRVVLVCIDEQNDQQVRVREIEDRYLVDNNVDEKTFVLGDVAEQLLAESRKV